MTQGIVGPMLATNVDPIAETKRVYYRPSTSTDTVRVGDLVCYNWDLTSDYKERSTNPNSDGTTYAEGSQNYTGRILIVEKPATANLQFFAGVVAKLGKDAGADGDLIEIYIPNGAVVPVMSDQYCTNGRTIVAVRNGAYEGSYPDSTSRPIGIAMETKDRSSTDGLVWTKLDPNMFLWNYHASQLLIDDEGTTNDHIVHKINVSSSQTGGRFTAFEVIATSSGGAAANGYGLALYVEADVSAAPSSNLTASSHWMNITGGTLGSYQFAVGEFGVYESGANLTGIDLITPLILRTQLDATNGPGAGTHWMFYCRCDGADSPDGLFMAHNKASIGAVSCTGDTAHDSSDLAIPIKIDTGTGNGTYYLIAQDSLG